MDPKPWYLSKTIIGAIVTTLASLVQVFGITLPVDLQAEIVSTILLVTTAGRRRPDRRRPHHGEDRHRHRKAEAARRCRHGGASGAGPRSLCRPGS